MRPYLVVMAVAGVATFAAVPPLRLLSRRLGVLAVPGDRTVHATPTPVLGGAALFVGFLAGLGAAALMPELDPVFESSTNVLGVLAAARSADPA